MSTKTQSIIERLAEDVKKNQQIVASATQLMANLSSQLRAAIASAADDNGDALNALAEALEKNGADLTAAIVANTPADPSNATTGQPSYAITASNSSGSDAVNGTGEPSYAVTASNSSASDEVNVIPPATTEGGAAAPAPEATPEATAAAN